MLHCLPPIPGLALVGMLSVRAGPAENSKVAPVLQPSVDNHTLAGAVVLVADPRNVLTNGYVYCGVISVPPGVTVKAVAYQSEMADSASGEFVP